MSRRRSTLGGLGLVGLALLASAEAAAQNSASCTDIATLGDVYCAGGSIHVTIHRDGDVVEQKMDWDKFEELLSETRAERARDANWQLKNEEFRRRLEVRLASWANERLDDRRRWRNVAWTSALTGGAALLGGIGFALGAYVANHDSSSNCDGNLCQLPGYDDRKNAQRNAHTADVLFIVGGVLGAAGGVGLYLLERGEVEPKVRSDTPELGRPSGVVFTWHGTW